MRSLFPSSYGVDTNFSTITNATHPPDRVIRAPQATAWASEQPTQTLAIAQAKLKGPMDLASFARLNPRALVENLLKNRKIEIDTEGNDSIKKQVVKDLVDIAATPVGRKMLFDALSNLSGRVEFTGIDINVVPGSQGLAENTTIILGAKLFAEDCWIVEDKVSSSRSLFTLFHELVHVKQNNPWKPTKMTHDQKEDNATKLTDVFITQFNAANGTNYPKRITYAKQTVHICPISTLKEVLTPEQLSNTIQEIKVDRTLKNWTQGSFVKAYLDSAYQLMEGYVRIEFGSDTLREPGGTGRRKKVLDSLLLLSSVLSEMRTSKPFDAEQLTRFLPIYTAVYKSVFKALSIDNIPSLPRRRDGSVVKQ